MFQFSSLQLVIRVLSDRLLASSLLQACLISLSTCWKDLEENAFRALATYSESPVPSEHVRVHPQDCLRSWTDIARLAGGGLPSTKTTSR